MPIVHTVGLAAKEGKDAELKEASDVFFSALKAGKVPGVTPVYFGPIHHNLDRCKPFTYILYMFADTAEALAAYGPSEPHMDYVKKITPIVEKGFIADFPADKIAYNLVHIVNFKVAEGKEDNWNTGTKHLKDNSLSGTKALPIDIIYAGPCVGAHNTNTHVLYTEFDKKASLDIYSPHAEHQHAVLNHLRPSSVPETTIVFDFEVGPKL